MKTLLAIPCAILLVVGTLWGLFFAAVFVMGLIIGN